MRNNKRFNKKIMNIYDKLSCPDCHQDLDFRETSLFCNKCKKSFEIINNLIDFFPDRSCTFQRSFRPHRRDLFDTPSSPQQAVGYSGKVQDKFTAIDDSRAASWKKFEIENFEDLDSYRELMRRPYFSYLKGKIREHLLKLNLKDKQ